MQRIYRGSSQRWKASHYANSNETILSPFKPGKLRTKIFLTFLLLVGLHSVAFLQSNQPTEDVGKYLDTLRQKLSMATEDSNRISIRSRIAYSYETLDVDSALAYYDHALLLARKNSYAAQEAKVLASISGVLSQQGKFADALEHLFAALKIAQDNNLAFDIARAYRRLGGVYVDLENYPKAITYLLQAVAIDEANKNERSAAIDHQYLSDAYEKVNNLDSAAYHLDIANRDKRFILDGTQKLFEIEGNIQRKKGNHEQAIVTYKNGYADAQKNNDFIMASQICSDLSAIYQLLDKQDSAIHYGLMGYDYAQRVRFKKGIVVTGNLLAELYDSTNPILALRYIKIASNAKDSLFGANNLQTIQNLVAREDARQNQLEDARVAYRNKLRLYGLITGAAVLLAIAFILFRNNRQTRKANALLNKQKAELQVTLTELKSTQAQLVQAEKMASLGELTAGIAHEIQNPLNFVNNFSEVSNELLDDMVIQMENGNNEEAKLIVGDLKQNLEKINHHGKRADSIVKGMLQHSRSSSGVKQPTDINALADEYLRLAYHGLRAKDKSFNATMVTDFDPKLAPINVVTQDIGRVVLNLLINAFYAVNEKAKAQVSGYEPTVSMKTRTVGDRIEISISDNGNGIPLSVRQKIFQPFFTTKPTGQGTGLGLSLAYDIVKAHGGNLVFDTVEKEGTTFTIQLPVAS